MGYVWSFESKLARFFGCFDEFLASQSFKAGIHIMYPMLCLVLVIDLRQVGCVAFRWGLKGLKSLGARPTARDQEKPRDTGILVLFQDVRLFDTVKLDGLESSMSKRPRIREYKQAKGNKRICLKPENGRPFPKAGLEMPQDQQVEDPRSQGSFHDKRLLGEPSSTLWRSQGKRVWSGPLGMSKPSIQGF